MCSMRAILVIAALALLGTASAKQQHKTGRQLLSPIYSEQNKVTGPETPAFRYRTKPDSASVKTDVKVRSEHPWATVDHFEYDWLNANGSTKVDTWEGAKFSYKAGKGGAGRDFVRSGQQFNFNSGKRAFAVNNQQEYNVNFPDTDIKIAGGQPLAVDTAFAVYPPNANEQVEFKSGDGPVVRNAWYVNAGPTMAGHGRRRSLLADIGRRLLSPIYSEQNKVTGPETPAFRYRTKPDSASVKTDVKVRSEHPWATVDHFEYDWLNANGSTKVDTWEGAKFSYKAGKGGAGRDFVRSGQQFNFNSGKRAFAVNNQQEYNVNFPDTDIKIAGGQPLAVDTAFAVYPPNANEQVEFKSGDGPVVRNAWYVNAGPTMAGHGRRRSLLADIGRRLLSPIYSEQNKVTGPETPAFRYRTKPDSASVKTDVKVRSEHPWATVDHFEYDWLNANGSTKVDTWEGAKFSYKAGKGGAGRDFVRSGQQFNFNSGKRAFAVNNQQEYNVNFPDTDIKIAGGQPLAVDTAFAVYPPNANEQVEFKSGDGPVVRNAWYVNAGPTMAGHGRRRSLLADIGRRLLSPIYSEQNKVTGPETPAFRYRTKPDSASVKTDVKVRSEHPWATVDHFEYDWLNANGSTKVDTWEGAKFSYKAGKGGAGRDFVRSGQQFNFNSGKRAFAVNNQQEYNVNFPDTDVKIAGGQPLAVDTAFAVYPPNANEQVEFKSGDGPVVRNAWYVNAGPTMAGHGRRRRQA